MAGPLVLIANPGSASRKYALYDGQQQRANLHFEWLQGRVICTLHTKKDKRVLHTSVPDLHAATGQLMGILRTNSLLKSGEQINSIGLRVVAPGAHFLEDRVINDDFIQKLEAALPIAPIHIAATLEELRALRKIFKAVTMLGVSDSAFHATKPAYAWNYGIDLNDADRFDIKRFGYHGLSVASVVHTLKTAEKLPPKLIVCHLGSGASVTAVHGGKSLDNTMGYSPLEGIIMATRSGSIDPTAVRMLKAMHNFSDQDAEDYLNNHSGLLGLGGSSDTRELLQRQAGGDSGAQLALSTYIYSVQKAVGQMASALGGADALVFTGTVGERSAVIRQHIVARLHYLDFILDEHNNKICDQPKELTTVSRLAHSKPVYVVPADESAQIARQVLSAMPL